MIKKTRQKGSDVEKAAELLCDLTRMCNIKEEHFASRFNLTPGEFRLLKLFVHRRQYSIRELCGQLNLTPGRITHLVTNLGKKGLISREINQDDKRNVTIGLTKTSTAFIKNVFKSHIGFHKSILTHVSQAEKKAMIKSLRILVDSFTEWIKTK